MAIEALPGSRRQSVQSCQWTSCSWPAAVSLPLPLCITLRLPASCLLLRLLHQSVPVSLLQGMEENVYPHQGIAWHSLVAKLYQLVFEI